jgi:hypothetical protein
MGFKPFTIQNQFMYQGMGIQITCYLSPGISFGNICKLHAYRKEGKHKRQWFLQAIHPGLLVKKTTVLLRKQMYPERKSCLPLGNAYR